MWPFKKKETKVYKITWRFCAYSNFLPVTEIVRAVDIPAAWKKIRKENEPFDVTLVSWEELFK